MHFFSDIGFGPGAGAIAGSISGIMLSLVSGEAAQIGILCLLGISPVHFAV